MGIYTLQLTIEVDDIAVRSSWLEYAGVISSNSDDEVTRGGFAMYAAEMPTESALFMLFAHLSLVDQINHVLPQIKATLVNDGWAVTPGPRQPTPPPTLPPGYRPAIPPQQS